MIADGHDNPRGSGNNLPDDGDNDSDGHDSLHSVFSTELNMDSADTDLSLEDNPNGLDNGLATSEGSRAGDSSDIPIVLDSDVSVVDMSGSATPSGPEREQETHKGFDERIPLSLSGPGQTDAANTNNRHNDGIEKTIDHHPRLTTRRGSSSPSSHSAEDRTAMPSERETATRDHEPRGGDEPNGRAEALEDVHKSSKGRVRFAKKLNASTSIHQNSISKPFRSDLSSRSHKRIGGLHAGDSGVRGGSIMVNDGGASSKKRPASDEVLRNLPIKRRGGGPELFAAGSSDSSDSESETTEQPIDAPRSRGTDGRSRSNLENTHLRVDGCQDIPSDEAVWEHGCLLRYKVVDGKPFVLVPWYPTWEPPDEYSKEEVDRVKRQWESRRPRRGPGRRW